MISSNSQTNRSVVQWLRRRGSAELPTRTIAEDGGIEMAKGQIKKAKTNKPKLSAKEKKKNKAAKKAAKAAK